MRDIYDPRLYISSIDKIGAGVLTSRSQPLTVRRPGIMSDMTVPFPTSKFLLPAELIGRKMQLLGIKIIERNDLEALNELNLLLLKQSSQLHHTLCMVFGESSTDTGVVHGNNGSELMAEINALVRYKDGTFKGKVLTFQRGGRVVNMALAGGDIREAEGVNLPPNTGIFTPRRSKRHTPTQTQLDDLVFLQSDICSLGRADDGYQIEMGRLSDIFSLVSDEMLLEQVRREIKDENIILAAIPVIDGLGKIWPWQKIGKIIDEENIERRKSGKQTIFRLLNAVQAIGRATAKDLQRPLDNFDAVVTVGYKGLGGAMVSGALIAKKDVLQSLYGQKVNLPWYIREYDAFYRKPYYCEQYASEYTGTISLPEIVSFNLALIDYYTRGSGKTFSERRQFMHDQMLQLRQQFKINLAPQFDVLEESSGYRLHPSIICLGLKSDAEPQMQNKMAKIIKDTVYDMKPSLVLPGNIGPVIRVSIPEVAFETGTLKDRVNFALNRLNTVVEGLHI